MSCADDHWKDSASDPVPVIVTHLRDGEDVIRCAAARALGALGDQRSAPALVDALLDEDPDVRADAMAALVACARASDADTIRRSLMGDPVREVKVSAIQALCRLDDRASLPLLQALAKDRCDSDVAWDEADGPWDDWLDVQLAAIEALGDMAAAEAVEDLLDARADEFGQDLDLAVFAALAKMPGAGIETLVGLVRRGAPRECVRSAAALSKAAPELLAPLVEDLAQDPDPDVRGLAVLALDADSPHVTRLTLEDPDPSIRCAALAAFGAKRHDLLEPALHDDSEDLRACALETIADERVSVDVDDFADNVAAWMQTGGGRLAVACIHVLQGIGGSEFQTEFQGVAENADRPEDVRLAAIRALGLEPTEDGLTTLTVCAKDPSRQIRLAALSALTAIAREGADRLSAQARDVLIDAMLGRLVGPQSVPSRSDDEPQTDVGVSKVEEAASGKIAISPDGEIVPAAEPASPAEAGQDADDSQPDGAFPTSTLEAIQAPAGVLSEAGEEPLSQDDLDRLVEGRPKVRRKRVAVDGPDDYAEDLRIVAIRAAAECPGTEIDAALADIADMAAPMVSLAALDAAALRSRHIDIAETLTVKLVERIGDPDPLIRGAAATALGNGSQSERECLLPLLDDEDSVVRATAVAALATMRPGAVIDRLDDPASIVRRAAMDHIVRSGGEAELERGIWSCLRANRTDCLAQACRHSARAREMLASALASQDMTRPQTQGALEALSSPASMG